MDTVVFDGVAYVKASTLAKRFRYTTDYIGQLCRAGKIDARLVGRSWYVNEAALVAHKEARYQPTRIDEKTSHIKVESSIKPEVEVTKVHPRLSRVTSKLVLQSEPKPVKKNFSSRLAFTPARYEVDEADLLPQPVSHEPEKAQKIEIEPAEATKIKIGTVVTTKEHLTFTEVPEVALAGQLQVKSLDYEPEIDDAPLVTITDFPVVEDEVVASLHSEVSPEPDMLAEPSPRARVSQSHIRFSPTVVPVINGSPSPVSSIVSITVVVLGMGLFMLLTMTTHVLIVEGGQLRSVVDFNLANVHTIWSLLD